MVLRSSNRNSRQLTKHGTVVVRIPRKEMILFTRRLSDSEPTLIFLPNTWECSGRSLTLVTPLSMARSKWKRSTKRRRRACHYGRLITLSRIRRSVTTRGLSNTLGLDHQLFTLPCRVTALSITRILEELAEKIT